MSSRSDEATSWRHRLYRGWWVVVAAIVGLSLSTGPLLVYTAGVFAKSLTLEFECDRASIAGAVSLLDIVGALAAPTAGRLVDRYGAQPVIASSITGLSLCLVGFSIARPPLWHLYFLYVAAGVVGVASTPVTYSRVVADWFDRDRAFSLGVAGAGVSLGAFITPSLAQFLLARHGWRFAYLCLAGISLVVATPVVAFFLLDRP